MSAAHPGELGVADDMGRIGIEDHARLDDSALDQDRALAGYLGAVGGRIDVGALIFALAASWIVPWRPWPVIVSVPTKGPAAALDDPAGEGHAGEEETADVDRHRPAAGQEW